MSFTKNKCVQCDNCGRLSSNLLGEYVKKNGAASYINPIGDDSEKHICDECAEGRCPHCGSNRIVRQTPLVAGPIGWGGRCKDCDGHWSIQTAAAAAERE